MARTAKYGIDYKTVYSGPPNSVIYVDDVTGRLKPENALPPALGGTGMDSATVGEGVARVTNGTWTFGVLSAADLSEPYVSGYILTTNTAGVLSWTAASGGAENVTVVNSSPYNVIATDKTLSVDTRIIPITINLPEIASVRSLTIIDTYGSAMNNNITIHPFSGNTILSSTDDVIIASANMAATFQSVSLSDWVVVSKN